MQQESIIVYRNPLEKAFYEQVLTWSNVVSFIGAVIVFIGLVFLFAHICDKFRIKGAKFNVILWIAFFLGIAAFIGLKHLV